MLDGNRVALASISSPRDPVLAWPPFVAFLAGVLLGILPARVAGEPKIDTPPPHQDKSDIKGSLVIVGGGILPESVRDRFLELAGGKKSAKLVVIPTASALADRTQNYKSYAYWRAQGVGSVSMLNTLDPKKANDPLFVKPLTEATAAWLGGGDQTRLAGAYHGTAVERELRRLLDRGGVVGGTSAGASVMSSIMITGGNPQARIGTGFGLLPDVVIDQHFENRRRQDRLLGVLALYPRCLGLGIDEQTAVVVHGHTFTVVGMANVVVCLPPGEGVPASVQQVLRPGEVGDLLLFSRTALARSKPPAERKTAATTDRRTMP
jgi:cyanophycinase